jgi:hypothetical protein
MISSFSLFAIIALLLFCSGDTKREKLYSWGKTGQEKHTPEREFFASPIPNVHKQNKCMCVD